MKKGTIPGVLRHRWPLAVGSSLYDFKSEHQVMLHEDRLSCLIVCNNTSSKNIKFINMI